MENYVGFSDSSVQVKVNTDAAAASNAHGSTASSTTISSDECRTWEGDTHWTGTGPVSNPVFPTGSLGIGLSLQGDHGTPFSYGQEEGDKPDKWAQFLGERRLP